MMILLAVLIAVVLNGGTLWYCEKYNDRRDRWYRENPGARRADLPWRKRWLG